ncbi:hypothetical protein BJX68DRAFT_173154 [Aspergillus pseudodeflectus]|uniref:Uncharacterized protein n=1 Tax=Aspergillus pseudodeflectus TaxID=176178 RepID=A0ABR4JMM6_9EURO
MASNANARGHHMPLPQTTRLEAFRSILKGVTSDPTRQRDDFRSSEPIHDDDAREVRDHWESPDKDGNQWRHGKVAGGSDRGSDRIEVNSLDASSLLEELKERIEVLESSMEEQERWNKEVNQAVDRLYSSE